MNNEKRETIYKSSSKALIKFSVSCLTVGISLLASIWDSQACYISIIVQSISNMYDFSRFTKSSKYSSKVVVESGFVIFLSIVAILCAVGYLVGTSEVFEGLYVKLICILFISFPLVFINNDYWVNVIKENISENEKSKTRKESEKNE